MPYASDKQRKWMHAAKPKMAAKWDEEEAKVKKKKGMYSDIDLKKNIEDGEDEIDKAVRGGVLDELLSEMTETEMGPLMMKITVTKSEPMGMEIEEGEEMEDEDELGKKLKKMAGK